jgi:hypothetical protein
VLIARAAAPCSMTSLALRDPVPAALIALSHNRVHRFKEIVESGDEWHKTVNTVVLAVG